MPGTPPARFAYLGPEGTFTEAALRTIPAAEHGVRTPARSVPEALEAVRSGEADAALVPLENSVGGAIPVTLDELITGSPLMITREVLLPVEFVLAARALTPLAELRTIAAHPQASAQCRHWLQANAPDAVVVDVLSNATAALSAAAGEHDAALCAPIGVPRNGLTVLAEKVADRADAVTRFALLTRPGAPAAPTGDDVTSLAVSIRHDQVGALLAVLTELAVRGVNLSRIESRPTGEQLGTYVFFLDCTGHVAEPRLGEALRGLRRICAEVRFLGSYPKHRLTPEPPVAAPPGLSDADFADSAAWLEKLRNPG
ncbi:putative prephenate dehydratase [Actinoplanes missouriensis 431]|uniref:Prephenate dehydratase n=1 Tax=Actinoplanes missouriensis (strain ATCC 14538 / DSM 43046 / CBS 188.64 / JCM 3121 / NBRC 102363 / NCIMB 12654 / NRRL B-3342 / UNCC 431) TaxID=512565 RepID=I0HJT0_ACTM4|nr:prephenate dehydratase [Actinoplanes missouriensis]BAL93267.1 putative prephenate dehydratase [Actinoplanes missouriensis 431]